jgi:hypothetical protein
MAVHCLNHQPITTTSPFITITAAIAKTAPLQPSIPSQTAPPLLPRRCTLQIHRQLLQYHLRRPHQISSAPLAPSPCPGHRQSTPMLPVPLHFAAAIHSSATAVSKL